MISSNFFEIFFNHNRQYSVTPIDSALHPSWYAFNELSRIPQTHAGIYMKLRKSQDEHLMFLHRLKIKPEVIVLEDSDGNEIPNSEVESST